MKPEAAPPSQQTGPTRLRSRLRWLRERRKLSLGLLLLLLLSLAAVGADFLAPYDPVQQNREFFSAPPTTWHWKDAAGQRSWRPWVTTTSTWLPNTPHASERLRVEWFVEGQPYRLWGRWPCRTRLFGVAEPGRIFLFGADSVGRDVFSRCLYGARLSLLTVGGALLLVVPLALVVGSLAGLYGGRFDFWSMRAVEVLMALPALYFVIALRSALPPDVAPERIFFLLVVVIALLGWAPLARVIRGAALELSATDFVQAARAVGASDWRLLRCHLWPNLTGVVLTQAALAAPGYLLAEVTLSYLGLGVPQQLPSWGNMLAAVEGVLGFSQHWWNLAPGGAIFLTSLAFYLIAEDLREMRDPRKEVFASIV